MPRISEFYGIVVYMYYRDHLPPHVHAVYAGHDAEVSIDTGRIVAGYLPRTAATLVLEWIMRYRPELHEDWDRARRHEPLRSIPPLD